jgi:crossover junction endodeoxyribonuclease RuvC
MKLIIGIDGGLTGALVALNAATGAIEELLVMPTAKKAKGNEVDAEAIHIWLKELYIFNEVEAVLEIPGKHSPGVMALCSMWDTYGVIRGLLATIPIRHHRIGPQVWQKKMLVGCAKGDTKPAALLRARQLWPKEKWLETPKCSKPSQGLIDAALIAEYGRTHL